jgi:glucokinase
MQMGNSSRRCVLAFDAGGTRLKAGVVATDDGGVRVSRVEAIAGLTADDVLASVARVGRELLAEEDCDGVGLCVPGMVDGEGRVTSLPGKLRGIVDYDLAVWLSSEFGIEPVVVNDAVAYGVGEATFGAGKAYRRVVVMTIGTGVGVALIQDGTPLTSGAVGGGTFGGHIPISERNDGYKDSNGRSDTIEALCCASRIVDYANEHGMEAGSVEDVYKALMNGRPEARSGIDLYRSHLVRGLVALAHAHAPEAIVIGGGPMTPGNPITDGVQSIVNERLFGSYKLNVEIARLGDTAGLYGLAYIHQRHFQPE